MAEQNIPEEKLTGAVARHLGLAAEALRLEPLSTGKYNQSYFVYGALKPLVLRVAPPDKRELNLFYEHRMMRQEPALHQTIIERTSVPVPRIITYDFSRQLLERDFLLMEKAAGRPLSGVWGLTRRELNRVLSEVGESLRQVHALQSDRHGYLGEHRPMEPQNNWRDAFVIMWNKLLDDIQGCGGYSKSEAEGMRRLLDRHIGVFDRYVRASLLHMDVWAQNILVDSSGSLSALLDWDRALWGDPEIEFAVLDYCGISEPAFWEGYGEKRPDDSAARTRGVFYLLYELQKYIFIRRVRGKNPVLADQYRRQSLELASQLGLRL